MNHPVEELFQRKKTDRRLSFTVYIIVILVLIGLLVIIGSFMGMRMMHYFPYRAQYYYFNYRFPFPPHFFLYITGWILSLIISSLTVSIVFWWYQWQLYKRRNEHIERVKSLKKSLIRWIKEKYNIDFKLWPGDEIQLSLREQRRGTGFFVLWVVLSYIFGLIGFVLTLVVWYWLTVDYYVHEKGEIQFFRQLADVLKEKGIPFNPTAPEPLPPRNMVLYIILMIIPGINLGWVIWWSYVLFRDPNVHFDTHEFWESQLEKIIAEPEPSPESPLEILKRRYAQGQITKEEFEQMKKDLEE